MSYHEIDTVPDVKYISPHLNFTMTHYGKEYIFHLPNVETEAQIQGHSASR